MTSEQRVGYLRALDEIVSKMSAAVGHDATDEEKMQFGGWFESQAGWIEVLGWIKEMRNEP